MTKQHTKITDYVQPPAGNTEKYINVKPKQFEGTSYSCHQAFKDYNIHGFGKGIEGVCKIIEHIINQKFNKTFKCNNKIWNNSIVAKINCELTDKNRNKYFTELSPNKLSDISPRFAANEGESRINDIYKYKIELSKINIPPIYATSSFLNSFGAQLNTLKHIYMLDGARRITASALNRKKVIPIFLILPENEFYKILPKSALNSIQEAINNIKWFENYQSLPLLNIKGDRTLKRFELMDLETIKGSNIIDFGSNLGQACIKAVQCGAQNVCGIEGATDTFSISRLIQKIIGLNNLHYYNIDFNTENFNKQIDQAVPGRCDYSFFLSVYRTKELTQRDKLFQYIINKTKKGIFFEGHAHPKIDTVEYYDWLFDTFGLTYKFLGYSEENLRPLFFLDLLSHSKKYLHLNGQNHQKEMSPNSFKNNQDYMLSAIISTYKSEKFIKGKLNDLLNQTISQKMEIIVIDSNSPENERKIVERYASIYPNIKYIRTPKTESIYKAWNRGIKIAQGKYITNANTDDRLRHDALEILVKELDQHPDVALAYGDFFITNHPNMTFYDHIRTGYSKKPDYSPEIMLDGCHMGPQPVWRKKVHEQIGFFDESYVVAGDYEFWCRIATKFKLRHIPKFLGLYFNNLQGIVNSNISLGFKETQKIKKMYSNQFPSSTKRCTRGKFHKKKASPFKYVNICMVTFNRLEFTKKAIDSIVENTIHPYTLTVVDNNSQDGSKSYLKKLFYEGIIKNLVLLNKNIGVASASNLAWQMEPEAQYYLKYDNDIVVYKPDWLGDMVATIDNVPQIGVLGYNFEPISYPLVTQNNINFRYKAHENIGGGCILIPKRTRLELGFWCEDYGLYGEEDADMGWRVKLANLINAYMPDENIGVHLPGGKAALVSRENWIAHNEKEQTQEQNYRRWKDKQRKNNFQPNSEYKKNTEGYKRGERPLFVLPQTFPSEYENLIFSKSFLFECSEKLSIIIPIYNNINLTLDCLNRIIKTNNYKNSEIILVDNFSDDSTPHLLKNIFKKDCKKIKLISNLENMGFAKACNQGAKEATGDYLIFLNNDTIPQKGWLESLVKFIKNMPNVGVVGCKLLYPDNTVQHCGASMNFRGDFFRHQYKFVDRDHSLVNDIRELDAVTAACFLTPRQTFLELGMFDEGYLNGCEDMDYCAKVKKAGLKIYYNPESVLYHLESQTSRPKNKDIENFNYYLKKWGYDYIKNEIEIYAEDGFWANKKGRYVKAENQHIAQFLSEIRMARIENDNKKLERFTKIINRIYPVEFWEKKNLKKNETKKYYSPKINSESFKILFVCHDFPPHRFAGAQLYAKNLAKELKKEKCHEIEIIYPVVRPPSPQDYSIATKTYEGLTVHEFYKPIGSEPEKVFDEKVYDKILDFLQENNFDLIHFHGFGQITLAPVFAAKKLQIPCIATLHDYWLLCDRWHLIDTNRRFCSGPESIDKCAKCFVGQNQPSADQFNDVKKYKNFRQEMTRKAFNLLDACFAPSDFLAQFYGSYGFSGVKKIPIGLSSIPLTSKNPDDDKIHFGFAGQIISRKGADILIQAFRKFPASSKACLHIWGAIQEEEYGKDFLGIVEKDSRIRYHGPFEQKDLPGIYDQIHIAIVPSLMENYPLTVLEAFAHKKPVIASKVGGIPEIVTDNQNGLLVPPGDGKALIEAMKKCLNPTFISSLSRNIPEIPTISDDAEKYRQEYHKFFPKQNITKLRVIFYFFKNVHIPILKPILETWKKLYPETEVAIAYMHYAPEIRAGFEPEELEQIKKLGLPMYERPQDFQPDITFIADSVYPWVRGCGKLVHIGHGLLSKGQYYTDTSTARREEEADLVCVPGKHHQKIMRRIISKPVIATGMAKLDPLFSGELTRQTVLKKYGLPRDKKYILFAPTFNDELSAIPQVKEKIADILPEEAVLLIKLHGSTKAEYKKMYRKLPYTEPQVIYVDDLDISPFLALADVLITDVSSTMFEFAALDKPVVLFDSPDWGKYENYNPEDIEFTWRDFALRTNTLEEMREAVKRSLEQPTEFSAIRTKYTQQLLANYKDGLAAERIVEAAHSLIQKPAES